jgi:hypothetical protein
MPQFIVPAAMAAGWPEDKMELLVIAAITGAAQLPKVPGITPEVLAAVKRTMPDAYAAAFRVVYLSSLSWGGLAIIAAISGISAKALLNDTVSRKLQSRKPHLTQRQEDQPQNDAKV